MEKQNTARDEEDQSCWICLEELKGRDSSLVGVCHCPRLVHKGCLAKWQMLKAGTGEETHCRFCSNELPDWKAVVFPMEQVQEQLGPSPADKDSEIRPLIHICVNGVDHYVEPSPGPDGLKKFTRTVKGLCDLADGQEQEDGSMSGAACNIYFGWTVPDPSDGDLPPIQLKGVAAYEALTHVAKLRASSPGKLSSIMEAKINLDTPLNPPNARRSGAGVMTAVQQPANITRGGAASLLLSGRALPLASSEARTGGANQQGKHPPDFYLSKVIRKAFATLLEPFR
eukprot:CAMPEP_0117673682 /NCGR_PEP_ID=MMETSP0804-20121206/14606_1 /TAXON_ID=1074897 /ORGANISM="Tetraselmis astigmatica, Strain CCMP880" /LENGTH=283 /DNA_ID=CAMNT_0005482443 /DNA_START=27 /DNA_END=878 /DNA_ORIENTATION=-